MIDIFCCFFFFNDTATTEIYTLSLHDALPISKIYDNAKVQNDLGVQYGLDITEVLMKLYADYHDGEEKIDRKSTRLNSSHANISYAVFCLKKKKKNK